MLTKIIAFSIKNKFIVGLFVLGLIGLGAYETTKLPIDAVPDITDNQVQIITVAPSFGATDIERLITFPIEQANSNISGLKQIRSFSRFGLSLVTVVFDDNTDIYWARQQIAERLQTVQNEIPAGIGNPELGPITTGLGEIYQYVVRAKEGYEDKYDETELRTIQDWIIRRQLLGVKGVAEVSSFGGKLKQFEVEVKPEKLAAHNITINEVFDALESNNQNTGGAYIEKNESVLFIRSEGLIGSIKDIENIAIKKTENGTPIFVSDVAQVKIGHATRYGAMTFNDKGEVSGAVVMMLKGANSSEVIKDVKSKVESIQEMLPEGVLIEAFLDRSKMVDHAIGTVEKNLLEGALIVVFILVVFLGNIRAGLLVASVIPLSLLFAIIMMNLFGVSGNLMSLGALDFGLIVDGSVIIVEAVMFQVSRKMLSHHTNLISQDEMDLEVKSSASKMMNSAVFGQIIILIVYLPIFTLQGIEGKMFKPMAQTVAFALLGAFILSLTYIPMMSALILSKKGHKRNISDKLMDRLSDFYQRYLIKAMRHPKKIITAILVLFAFALFLGSRLGGEFIPALEEGDFAVEARIMTGSNLNATIETTQKAAKILLDKFPEVTKIVTKIGSGEVPTDPMPMEASDLMVILKDKKEWTSAKSFDELSIKMEAELSKIPGLFVGFQFPVQMRFNELMTGARQDVVCKIYGEDLDTLSHYANLLGSLAQKVEGTKDMFVEPIEGAPQIVIDYNRAVLAQHGLTISEVNKIVNTAFAGQTAGLVFEQERRFNLVVKLDQDSKKNLLDVQNMLIPTSDGLQIPLNQLANVDIVDGPNQIQREDAKRRIVVGFNVHGRDVKTIVNELQERTNKEIKLPPGYNITYGGSFENLQQATSRLMVAVPIALALIFILLYFAFGSIKQGLLIYTAIPLSTIGGIYFLSMRDLPFSISAGIGFIALFGVAVLNGIVLVAEFNRLRKNGMTNLNRVVLTGTHSRLRPVLMTAAVASLGFLPMALSNGAGAEVQRPLATVVIGGLLIATFLTLFMLPILYLIFERPKKKMKKLKTSSSLVLLFILLSSAPLNAQTKINVEAAVDTAIKNSYSMKSEMLMAEYQKKLIKSAWNIEQADVSIGFGQMNSAYNDNQFGVSQSFQFPSVYIKQRKQQEGVWKKATLGVDLQKYQIKKEVSQLFYSILILQEKEKLLLETNEVYTQFLQKSNARFEEGESSILEKITAENQQRAIEIQLSDLHLDLEIAKLLFKLQLNIEGDYVPTSESIKHTPKALLDSNEIQNHPYLQRLKQEQEIAKAGTELERSKHLPNLNLGYSNTTMRGTGADDVLYSSQRFNSGQVGIGIPIFFGGQQAKVNAAKVMEKWTENKYALEEQQMTDQFKSTLARYQKQVTIVNQFETKALKNADLILKTANDQFQNGSINYLEWSMVINQAVAIKTNYLDAIQSLNDNLIELHYLISK